MEAKINIAEILKDKTVGTKLWSPICGECTLHLIKMSNPEPIEVAHGDNGGVITLSRDGKYFLKGESVLFPSKQMRDWDKFAWKKGDVLVNNIKTIFIIFNEFEDDTYGTFKGKYCLTKISSEEEYTNEKSNFSTSLFEKATDDAAQSYIKTIEKKLGGKFNRETLEVEKPHPEFKDGDIITITPQIGDNLIFIFRAEDVEKYYCHAFLDGNIAIVNDDGYCKKDFCTARPSTEEDQKQLFDALAKKGKAWDAEKKAIVDLKPKCEFKPFDRCIWKIRNCEGAIWQASFVSYVDEYGATPMGMSIDEDLVNLIILPYNDQTKLLVGTTDEWKGGEQ